MWWKHSEAPLGSAGFLLLVLTQFPILQGKSAMGRLLTLEI